MLKKYLKAGFVKMATIKDFKTIIKPIITEKSSMGSEYNQVTFQVQKTSSKKEIKLAIENILNNWNIRKNAFKLPISVLHDAEKDT